MYRVRQRVFNRLRAIALITGLISMISLPVHARLYKWTDAEGNTIYSQTPPPTETRAGHTELNERGLTLREVEAPLSEEEKVAREVEARKKAETAALLAWEEREDRMLLESFPSLEALEQARDFRLETLDQKIRYLTSRRSDANSKLERNGDRISNFRRKKLDIPEQLAVEKVTLDHDILKLGERIANTELERAVVAAGFAADRARYMRIMAERKAKLAGG